MAGIVGAGSVGAGRQIIDGKSYDIYSPEWYDAVNASKIKTAGVSGTAEGTAEANKLTALAPALQGLFGAIGNGSGTSGGGSGGGVGRPATLAPVDTSAATQAAFGQAKDQVGQETAGALAGLRSALAGRGLLGSAAESRGTTNVITKGQQQLGDVTREGAMTQADIARQEAGTNLSAAVTQRGQDIAREQNVMQAQNQQAQLQLQARQMQLNALQAALSGSVQSY